MPATFISYRREDSAGYAGRLHEELAERFGAGQVFRDVDTLRPGQDFENAIRGRLEQCDACVVMIGPGWLRAQNAAGQRRLGAAGDYVTMEIAAALARPDVAVVPVLVGGASMPAPEDLPEALRPLARRHAFTTRDETWEADMDRLAAVLRPSGPRQTPKAEARQASSLARYAVPALVVILLLGAVSWFTSREPDAGSASQSGPGGAGSDPSDAGRASVDPTNPTASNVPDSPAYAIDVPASMGEAAHGDLIYAVVAGSVQRRGSGMRVWLRIRMSNEGFYGANFWDDSFRLVAGGQTIAPNGGLNELIDRRSIQQGVVRFDLPTAQRTATLRISNNERTADLPLDLSGNGSPPKHDEQDPRDALSHAVLTAVVRNEFPLITGDDVAVDVMRISRRAFVNTQRITAVVKWHNKGHVNTQRITAVVKWHNKGRYDMATGDLTLRLAAGGEVLAPFRSPSEVVASGATYVGDVVFDVPPQIAKATLRAELRGRQKEQELTLR